MSPQTQFGITQFVFAISLLLVSTSCARNDLKVIYLPTPDYPLQARSQGVQGVVVVTEGIGTDGRVTYAVGKGASAVLVDAAQENAKGWKYEVPARATFPLEHQIKYTFTFNKDGTANLLPTVMTDLPNSIEVIATPARGDEFMIIPREPHPDKQKDK